MISGLLAMISGLIAMISGLPTLITSIRSVNNNFVKYNQMSWLNKNYNTKKHVLFETLWARCWNFEMVVLKSRASRKYHDWRYGEKNCAPTPHSHIRVNPVAKVGQSHRSWHTHFTRLPWKPNSTSNEVGFDMKMILYTPPYPRNLTLAFRRPR